MRLFQILFIILSLLGEFAFANNAQSTLNIFSPNNDQSSFTLVERSLTTERKYFNTVLFYDFSAQSQAIFGTADIDAKDTLSFVHLGAAYGLTDKLEIGGRFPLLLNQSLSNSQLGSSLELTGNGFTNIIAYLKYNVIKKENSGISILAQVGTANSESNFYIGEGSGPNLSLSFIFDKKFGKWLAGLNLGYTARSPGDREPSYLFYEPIDSTIQASLGLSRILSSKSRLSFELLVNQHTYDIDQSDREKTAMESFLSYRRQLNKKLKFTVGGGFGLNDGLAVPAFRGFAGLNYKFTFKKRANLEEEVVEVEPVSQEEPEEVVDEEPETVEEVEEVVVVEEPPAPIEETVTIEEESVAPKIIEQTITIDEEDEVSAKLEEFDEANKAEKAEFQKIILNYVEFEFNSYTLNTKSKKTLTSVAKYLESADFKTIEIIGHTDFYGKTLYNEVLSLRRARSVRNFFVEQGIEKNKMKFNGYGKRRPITTGTSERDRKRNRRVEIILRNNDDAE